MCLGIPARIVEVRDGGQAVAEVGGVRQRISLALLPDAKVGDFVVVHVGYALTQLDPAEAHKTLELLRTGAAS